MWSKYLKILEKNDNVAIFHELHPDPIFLSKREWESMYSTNIIPKFLSDTFFQKEILVSSYEDDELSFKRAEKYLLEKLQHVTILYLMTAQGCDLNCGYCPVQDIAKKFGASLLSKKSARAGIDLWVKHLNDVFDQKLNYNVIFYGGEPLLNKPVILDSLKYLDYLKDCNVLPKIVHYMVVTNGMGIDTEFVNMCIHHNVSVAIGLDGHRQANDILKVDISGQPTYDRIVQAIELLVSSGITTYASCSITPHNLDSLNTMGDFFKNLGIKKFGFNFLRGQKLIDLVGLENIEQYYRQASRSVIELARNDNYSEFEFQMEKKIQAYNNDDFFPVDCTCYGNQLVIQPDGQVSNCPFHKALLGDVNTTPSTFRIGNQSIVQEWRKRLPLYHNGYAKSLSGGGCTWGVIDQKHNKSIIDLGSRIFAEEVLNEFIWNTCRT